MRPLISLPLIEAISAVGHTWQQRGGKVSSEPTRAAAQRRTWHVRKPVGLGETSVRRRIHAILCTCEMPSASSAAGLLGPSVDVFFFGACRLGRIRGQASGRS